MSAWSHLYSVQGNSAHSPHKLGGDALRAARAGAVCSKTTVPINKERFASICKVATRL
jgi:hypothetical protein